MRSLTRWMIVVLLTLCVSAQCSFASGNSDAKWGVHFAGLHDAKNNTCAFGLSDCSNTTLVSEGPSQAGRYDVFVLALDVSAIAGTRFGICCEGSFYFYGWTKCSDFQIATSGWPACGEGNALTWSVEQYGPHVTIGLLDVYVYGASKLGTCADPRVGYAQWCDGTTPSPVCDQISDSRYFGSVGFGQAGYNPCGFGGLSEETSWGRLKSFYKH